MHEADLEGVASLQKPRPNAPTILHECIAGDRVRAWMEDGWVELVVTNTSLVGTVWGRRLGPDGSEGEFEPFDRNALIEVVELR